MKKISLNNSNTKAYKKMNDVENVAFEPKPAERRYAKLIARVFSLLVIASMFVTFISFYKTNTGSQSMTNWSIFSFLTALITVLTLSTYAGKPYWVQLIGKKKIKLDERQLIVKGRVIQKSYNTLILLIIVSMIFVTPMAINNFNLTETKTISFPVIEMVMYMLGLPSMFAAWEKDS